MKVLYLTLYPKIMPSSRYRVYQYLPYLKSQGIDFDVYSAVPNLMFKYLYNTRNFIGNLSYEFCEITNRIYQLFKSKLYDVMLVQKSLTTINLKGLPNFLKKTRIIFDIDDNVFQQPISTFTLKFLQKFQDSNQAYYLAWISKAVIVGNEFLKTLIYPYNKNIYLIPTSIDTDRFRPDYSKLNNKKIVIGWMGSLSTSPYLGSLTEVLQKLQQKYSIEIRIVGDTDVSLPGVKFSHEQWSYEQEVRQLQEFDIGIMPMPDNEWTRGKCGLKLLQYMACGIPAVCSPVGVNREIIQDGINGFWANSKQGWIEKLSLLINDSRLRRQMGMLGRRRVEERYSLKVNAPRVKQVLEQVYNEDV